MLEPRMSHSTGAWLERLQALPLNRADHCQAHAEFLRAERAVENVVGLAGFRRAAAALRRAFALRRQRLG